MTDAMWSQHALAKAALAKGNGYELYDGTSRNPFVSVRVRFGVRRR